MWGAFEGMGWWMVLGTLSWVLFLGAILFLGVTGPGRRRQDTRPIETPLDIARRRYASGDISQQEFEHIREELAK
jgi:uncharacterized membrane protein